MDTDALALRIRHGEDSRLELKRVQFSGTRIAAPKRSDLADEMAAMANTSGGTVVLGVDDKTRSLLGIPPEKFDIVEEWIVGICEDSIEPPLDMETHKVALHEDDGGAALLVVVEIERSLFVHRSPGGYFRRQGSSKRQLRTEALARLFQERSQTRSLRFDETPVPKTSMDHIDPTLTGRYFRSGTELSEVALSKLGVAAKDESGHLRLTVAGVLMCTRDPSEWLPHAQIQAVSYAGDRTDTQYQTDARDITGPLDAQVFEALHFLKRNMLVSATKTMVRAEVPQFSVRAVFEALVNAVAHRDYSIRGSRIRFHMFGDRLELYVPGGLANTLTTDNMELRQYSRNEMIVSLLARCPAQPAGDVGRTHLMDRRGDGVPVIIEASEQLSGRTPVYTLIDDSELRLVIWAASAFA